MVSSASKYLAAVRYFFTSHKTKHNCLLISADKFSNFSAEYSTFLLNFLFLGSNLARQHYWQSSICSRATLLLNSFFGQIVLLPDIIFKQTALLAGQHLWPGNTFAKQRFWSDSTLGQTALLARYHPQPDNTFTKQHPWSDSIFGQTISLAKQHFQPKSTFGEATSS